MNVIVFASRKGGTGKSTLAAHLAAYVHKPTRPCLLVDADPQGSLTLWHRLRESGEPPLKNGLRGITSILNAAERDGAEWVFIDTPPMMSAAVTDLIRAATLVVIPARPGVFDLNAIKETIDVARRARRPFAVVLNACPPKRLDEESPMVMLVVERDFGLSLRSRPDQAHRADEHVEKLGQFIERIATDEPSDWRDPRIVFDLVQWAIAGALCVEQ